MSENQSPEEIDTSPTPKAPSFSDRLLTLSPLKGLDLPIYFEILDKELSSENTVSKNIAITGGYGSGKSSVIESFLSQRSDLNNKTLRISLAHFKEYPSTPNGSREIDRGVQDKLLQQLFYQLSNEETPFSRFKKIRISHLKDRQSQAIKLTLWIISLFFIENVITSFNSSLEFLANNSFSTYCNFISWPLTLVNFIVTAVFTVGLTKLIEESILMVMKGRFRKITLAPADIELAPDSVLNKHIDEIIYFFSSSNKRIVIIEDIDRFESTTLFGELREVNFLINNSPNVQGTVKFIYAVKDELFESPALRTKFFDFILPITPVVNTSNSSSKLREYLKGDNSVSKRFLDDIGLFIHDLRLLRNIVNEFIILSEVLNPDTRIIGDKIFGIAVFKNVFSEQYELENQNGGILKYIFTELKLNERTRLINILKEELDVVETSLKGFDSVRELDENKLRKEYVDHITTTNESVIKIGNLSPLEYIAEPEYFKTLYSNPILIQWDHNSQTQKQANSISFDKIQSAVNSEFDYEQRLSFLKEKNSKAHREISLKAESIKSRINALRRASLKELLNTEDKIDLSKTFSSKKINNQHQLLIFLLQQGYIDENYEYYMSHFYEGALVQSDMKFLLNIKSNRENDFEREIRNPSLVCSKIWLNEYRNPSTINITLIEHLLQKASDNESRLNLIFGQFESDKNSFQSYILPLLKTLKGHTKETLILILSSKHYPHLWAEVNKLEDGDLDKNDVLRCIVKLPNYILTNIGTLGEENSLKNYIEHGDDILNILESVSHSNLKKLIETLNIKFTKLNLTGFEDSSIVDFIISHSYYALNLNMIKSVLAIKRPDLSEENLESRNLSHIFESSFYPLIKYMKANLTSYLEEVYQNLETDQNESLETILYLFENLSPEDLETALNKISSELDDITSVTENETLDFLFSKNLVKPNWKNLTHFFLKTNNTLSSVMVNWINEHSESLSKNTLHKNVLDSLPESEFKPFPLALVRCNQILPENHKKLMARMPYYYNELDLSNIDDMHVMNLISERKIRLDEYYLKYFIEQDKIDLASQLVQIDKKSFIENINSFTFNEKLTARLLESKSLTIAEKAKIVSNISKLTSPRLANAILETLIKKQDLTLEFGLLLELTKISNDKTKLVKALLRHIDHLTNTQVESILQNIGGDYNRAIVSMKRPKWDKTPDNQALAQKLLKLRIISSFEEVKGKLEVRAKFRS